MKTIELKDLTGNLEPVELTAVLDYSDSVNEYLAQADFFAQQGVSLKQYLESELHDKHGVWCEATSEASAFDAEGVGGTLASALQKMDVQLASLVPTWANGIYVDTREED